MNLWLPPKGFCPPHFLTLPCTSLKLISYAFLLNRIDIAIWTLYNNYRRAQTHLVYDVTGHLLNLWCSVCNDISQFNALMLVRDNKSRVHNKWTQSSVGKHLIVSQPKYNIFFFPCTQRTCRAREIIKWGSNYTITTHFLAHSRWLLTFIAMCLLHIVRHTNRNVWIECRRQKPK